MHSECQGLWPLVLPWAPLGFPGRPWVPWAPLGLSWALLGSLGHPWALLVSLGLCFGQGRGGQIQIMHVCLARKKKAGGRNGVGKFKLCMYASPGRRRKRRDHVHLQFEIGCKRKDIVDTVWSAAKLRQQHETCRMIWNCVVVVIA